MSGLSAPSEERRAELQRLSHADLIDLLLAREATPPCPPSLPQPNPPTSKSNKRPHSLPSNPTGLPSPPLAPSSTPSAHPPSKRPRKSSTPRPFDWWSYPLRHIALRFLYVGTDYHGLAFQPSPLPTSSPPSPSPSPPSALPTVESALFAALLHTRLIHSRTSCHYQRCGRTDAGVHASGQLVSVWLRSRTTSGVGCVPTPLKLSAKAREEARQRGDPLPPDDPLSDTIDTGTLSTSPSASPPSLPIPQLDELDYPALLNRHLPPTIRVLSATPVPLTFSARFSCTSRTYHYLCYQDRMDLVAMRAAAARMLGTHDWRNFCKHDAVQVEHFIRTIDRVDVVEGGADRKGREGEGEEEKGEGLRGQGSRDAVMRVEVEGRGFLYHQVRCMVGVLFAVGRGEESPDVVTRLLDVDQHSRKPTYRMASERGLILHYTAFPSSLLPSDAPPCTSLMAETLRGVYGSLFQQQRVAQLSAEVLRHMRDGVRGMMQGMGVEEGELPWQVEERKMPVVREGKRGKVGKGEQGAGGMLGDEAGLQASWEEKVAGLKGRKKERREEVMGWRESWRQREEAKRKAMEDGAGEGDRDDVDNPDTQQGTP